MYDFMIRLSSKKGKPTGLPFCSVMIFFSEHPHEAQGQGGGHQLGGGCGDPDAVHAKHQRQQEDEARLKDQGPEEGDEGGDEAVVQGGEEA